MSLYDPKYLDQETYNQIFAKHETYRIFKPLIQDRNTLRFHLKEDDYQLREGLDGEELDLFFDGEMRDGFVSIFRNRPEGKVFAKSIPWEGWDNLRPVISEFPKAQIVGVDRTGQVMRVGGGEAVVEQAVGEMVFDTTVIDGYVYLIGRGKIWRRDAADTYTLVAELGGKQPLIFRRIAGIAANDFYVADEQGALFHFDGQQLNPTSFQHRKLLQEKIVHQSPTIYENKPEPEQITCIAHFAPNELYLGTSTGRVLAQTTAGWIELKRSQPEQMTYPIRNIVKCQERIFVVTGFWGRYNILNRQEQKHLWEIIGNKVQLANVPEEVHDFAETLDAKDGVLLVAGSRGALLWDGIQWEVVIDVQAYHTLSAEQLEVIEADQAAKAIVEGDYEQVLADIRSKTGALTAEMSTKLEELKDSPKYWMSGLPPLLIREGWHAEGFEILSDKEVQVIQGDLSSGKCLEFYGPLTLVFGNVSAQNLIIEGEVFIQGNLQVENVIYAYSESMSKLWVGGDLQAKTWLSLRQQLEVHGAVAVEHFCTQQSIGYRMDQFPEDQEFITDLDEHLVPELFKDGALDFEELLMRIEKNEAILRS